MGRLPAKKSDGLRVRDTLVRWGIAAPPTRVDSFFVPGQGPSTHLAQGTVLLYPGSSASSGTVETQPALRPI